MTRLRWSLLALGVLAALVPCHSEDLTPGNNGTDPPDAQALLAAAEVAPSYGDSKLDSSLADEEYEEYEEYEEDEDGKDLPEDLPEAEEESDAEAYEDYEEYDYEVGDEVGTEVGDEVGDEDDKEGAGDGEVQARDKAELDLEVEDDGEVVQERRAEVRSLSDLPLSKLLRVQNELRRLTGRMVASKDQCDTKDQEQQASRRWLGSTDSQRNLESRTTSRLPAVKTTAQPSAQPSAQPLNWGGGSRAGSTPAPVRRGGGGGWQEEWEEEEDDGGGWISWNKGKKKGKGDIGSIFQISVTFLAFLAFGGYLLCLIMHAIKGGGYYPYYGASQGQVRPANLMIMMPTRLGTRRPTRPASAAAGRKRRKREERAEQGPSPAWWPTLGEEDVRLLPQVDVDRMHRALLVLAEGYASFYHKRYTQRQA